MNIDKTSISKEKYLEHAADFLQFAVPICCGIKRLVKGNLKEGAALALAGAIHSFGFPYLKKCFPHQIRPNGKPSSFPSAHTSACFLGISFLYAKEGFSPFLVAACAATALTAFSRWYTLHHWKKDLVGGAITGTILGFLTARVSRA